MANCEVECWCEFTEAAAGDVVPCGMYITNTSGKTMNIWSYARWDGKVFSPDIYATFWDLPNGAKKLVGLGSIYYMPASNVTVTFVGNYQDAAGSWIECARKTITINLRVGTGSIYATSSPTGASVYLEGTYKGTSPITISNVPTGQRWVKFIKTGYIDKVVFVTVVAGQTVTAHAVLEAITHKLRFVPSLCYVSNPDASKKAYLDQTIELSSGTAIWCYLPVQNQGDIAGTPKVEVYDGGTLVKTYIGSIINPGITQHMWFKGYDMPNRNLSMSFKLYVNETRQVQEALGCDGK